MDEPYHDTLNLIYVLKRKTSGIPTEKIKINTLGIGLPITINSYS